MTSREGASPRAEARPAEDLDAPADHVSWGRRARTWAKELAIITVSALVLSVVIKTFFFQSFWIPSVSMESTLEVGDRILVTKWRPGPLELRHGDIVVFKDPSDWLEGNLATEVKEPNAASKVLTAVGILPADAGEHLVKRVIGLPGDHVVCCDEEGRLSVNGLALDEPYLDAGVAPSNKPFEAWVPEGYVWVMGDNRSNSSDSRRHRHEPGGGAISMDLIVGVVFATVWPLDHWTGHGDPYADVVFPAAPQGAANPTPSPSSTPTPQ